MTYLGSGNESTIDAGTKKMIPMEGSNKDDPYGRVPIKDDPYGGVPIKMVPMEGFQ